MELRDSLVPFQPKSSDKLLAEISTEPQLRIDILSNVHALHLQIETALRPLRALMTAVDRVDHAKNRIKCGDTDLTIVHVHCADVWPGLAFTMFDELRSRHPIVMICRSAEEALHYQARSEHIIEILPEAAVIDCRFQYLIQGAKMRAEFLAPHHHEDKHPPAA